MTEPTTSTAGGSLLLAFFTASLGPLLGEWTLIIVGGFVGSFLAVTALDTPTIKSAAVVIARGMGMSCLFTGLVAVVASTYVGSTVDMLLLPVAGAIGWQQDKLLGLAKLLNRKGTP